MQYNFDDLDPTIDTGTGLANDLNAWKRALETNHSGSSRPTYATPGLVWINTTVANDWKVYLYNGSVDVLLGNIVDNVFLAPAAAASAAISYMGRYTFGVGVTAWVPPVGATRVRFDIVAGGGSGGGTAATAAGEQAAGSGGASGGRGIKDVTAASELSKEFVITVPASVAGVTGGNGQVGGNATVKNTVAGGTIDLTVPGGGAGAYMLSSSAVAVRGGGQGGVTANFIGSFDQIIEGNAGGQSVRLSGGSSVSGNGAASPLGGGAPVGVSSASHGFHGVTPGAGGAGANATASNGNRYGGSGGPGQVIADVWGVKDGSPMAPPYILVANRLSGVLAASKAVIDVNVTEACILSEALPGTLITGLVAATAQTDFAVMSGATQIATIRVPAGQLIGRGLAGSGNVAIPAETRVRVLGPASPDATFADVTASLRLTRS